MTVSRGAEHKTHFDSKQELRPIFTSLNGDNSWLLSFPRPFAERQSTGKAYFHIVHDPWLNGPEVQVSSWVVHLALSSPPAVSGVTGVERLVLEIESAAAEAGIVRSSTIQTTTNNKSPVDAIFVNMHYGDHLHKPTLLSFPSSVPVFTTPEGALVIKKLNHFDTITTYKDLDEQDTSTTCNWTTLHPSPILPSYITIFRIKGHHELNFLSALIWTSESGTHEAILYSPHSLHTSTPALQTFLHRSTPSFSTLAILHGLKESWTWNWQTTFGVAGGLQLYRESGAKYWISTHNSRLSYGGLVWWFANDIFRTLEWGLEQEKGGGEGEVRKEVKVEEVKNGDCFVLV